jgi:hypothetical protein
VVVLGIVFENLGFLLVIEVADKVVEIELVAPFLAVDKPVFILVYAARKDVRVQRTSSLKVPHRTCGLVEIVAGRHCQPKSYNNFNSGCAPESRYPVAQYTRPAQAWFATGRPGHLALGLCGQGDRSACLGRWSGSRSDRTWDQAAYRGFRTPW